MNMTSREKILAAIHHQESDRIPVDLGSIPGSGISVVAYQNLIHYLNKSHLKTHVYDVIQEVAQTEMELIDHFGADILDIGRTLTQVKNHVKHNLAVFSKGGGFVFNTVHTIMPDVPPQNIVTMFDAINVFNKDNY
jgi:uroporphyrinogen-III decarboxylase